MAKPNIKSIQPIDAKLGGIIAATYSGDLPYSNKLTIRSAEDLSVVYENTVTTHALSQEIPADKLINGSRYSAEIQFFDEDGEASTPSDKTYFLTLSTPIFNIDGLRQGIINTVKNSEIELTINYSQNEGEKLNEYQFTLYDVNQRVLNATDIMYNVDKPTTLFKGLENRETYYVRAKGMTAHNIACDTGLIQLFVDYRNPLNYAKIYVESDLNGVVNGYTNINVLEPTDNNPDHFIFEDGYIDLRQSMLEYNDEYSIAGDFVIGLRIKNFNKNTNYFKICKDGGNFINLISFMYDGMTKFKLSVTNGMSNYIKYSESMNIADGSVVTIWIKKIGGIYQLNIIKS